MDKKYILRRKWQSNHGTMYDLYLGYENNKVSCVMDKKDAIYTTKEDCEDWLSILLESDQWVIEEVDVPNDEPNQAEQNEEQNGVINNNESNG